MRDTIQKKKSNSQREPANRKPKEVTITKHCQPDFRACKVINNLPKIRIFPELPENKYVHLHPVFSFVENFFNNTAVNTNRNSPIKRQISAFMKGKPPVKKCVCFPDTSTQQPPQSNQKALVVQKSLVSCGLKKTVKHDKKSCVTTNLANINRELSKRVPLSKICRSCRHENTVQEAPVIPETSRNEKFEHVHIKPEVTVKKSTTSMDSDFYVEQLKDEIKQISKQNQKTISCPNRNSISAYLQKLKEQYCPDVKSTDEYVQTLKDEILCNKARCLENTRNVINNLQDEILTYRLQTKTKYSSSCSNLGNEKNCSTPSPVAPAPKLECKRVEPGIGENPKGVRVTCSESRQVSKSQEPPSCKPYCETIWHSKLSVPSSINIEFTPNANEINFDAKLEEAHTLIERVRAALRDIDQGILKVPELKKLSSNTEKCVDSNPQCSFSTKTKQEKKTSKREKVKKSKVSSLPQTGCPGAGTSECPNKEIPRKEEKQSEEVLENEESIEALQDKLNTISEGTESDPRSVESGNLEFEVARIERGSSPIDFPRNTTLSPNLNLQNRQQQESSPISIDSTSSKRGDSTCRSSCSRVSKLSGLKSSKLSIQVLPPVSIQGSLVIQRTLQLSIKPSGSVTNGLNIRKSNVAYHVMNAEERRSKTVELPPESRTRTTRCPEDCEKPTSPSSSDIGKKRVSISPEPKDLTYKPHQMYSDKSVGSVNSTGIRKLKPTYMSNRDPVEIGFYKTVAIQCNEFSLEPEQQYESGDHIIAPHIDRDIKIPSSTSGLLSEMLPQIIKLPSEEPSAVFTRSRTSSVKSASKISERDLNELPVKETPASSKSTIKSDTADDLPHQKSIESSSGSSFSVHGSFSQQADGSSLPQTQKGAFAQISSHSGVKRRHDSSTDTLSIDSAPMSVPGSIPPECTPDSSKSALVKKEAADAEKAVSEIQKDTKKVVPDKKEQVADTKKVVPDVQDVSDIKETQKPSELKNKELKVDENIQVFLGSSSSEDDATIKSTESIKKTKDQAETIHSFIKGLTGTSQEQLQNFQSHHSLHYLRSVRDQKNKEEELVETHDLAASRSVKSILSEIEESDKVSKFDDSIFEEPIEKKKHKHHIIMRLQEECGGEINRLLPRKLFPFYRRVLGKAVGPSSMLKSQSSEVPIDESISEGEVKFRNSYSIGEVVPKKYDRKRKDRRSDHKNIRFSENFDYTPLFEDSLSIARQRAHYNQWVTHYMRKQGKKAMLDISSSSNVSSSKR